MRILFDQGPSGPNTGFDRPQAVVSVCDMDNVDAALAQIDDARASGKWIAGFASYELGYALEPKLHARMPDGRRVPLLQFGIYDAPCALEVQAGPAALTDFTPRWSEKRYTQAFEKLAAYIRAGDVYQGNLTFGLDADFTGTARALYAALCDIQSVGYGALIEDTDGPDILCRSPELFFKTDQSGQIQTRPMKGTLPVAVPKMDNLVENQRRRDFLASDIKNRAENLMIVDLLRNDISRVCEIGSVKVPELFKVETYATVHQMTSLVVGQLMAGTSLGDIFRALFPCGSITGAPKVRAMEVLNDLEDHPRDIYCGTIGWAAPDGSSQFNVAIRTLLLENGQATLNVGGGVVYDSTAASEYEEALWKAKFAKL